MSGAEDPARAADDGSILDADRVSQQHADRDADLISYENTNMDSHIYSYTDSNGSTTDTDGVTDLDAFPFPIVHADADGNIIADGYTNGKRHRVILAHHYADPDDATASTRDGAGLHLSHGGRGA